MKQRIITGTITGVIFLTLLYLGNYWFASLIFVLAAIGYDEYLRLNKFKSNKLVSVVGFIFLLLFVAPWGLENPLSGDTIHLIVWLFMLALFVITVLSKNNVSLDQIAIYFIGTVYLAYGFHYMIMTRTMEHGLFWSLLLFVCIWATDSGAYFCGWAFGNKLLWPAISPKKTVEGAIGGVFISILAAICFALYAPHLIHLLNAVLLGGVIALAGQAGDLIQSAYKRAKGVKDTGKLLPGHGGVLDRVDSWLIVFPLVNLLHLIS